MIVLFGLATCDRCRRARRWLAEDGVDARFVDLRKEGLAPETLDRWIDALGVEALVNRRGTTWRNLPPDVRSDPDENALRALMLANPALIRRPVWDIAGSIRVGFDESAQPALRDAMAASSGVT